MQGAGRRPARDGIYKKDNLSIIKGFEDFNPCLRENAKVAVAGTLRFKSAQDFQPGTIITRHGIAASDHHKAHGSSLTVFRRFR